MGAAASIAESHLRADAAKRLDAPPGRRPAQRRPNEDARPVPERKAAEERPARGTGSAARGDGAAARGDGFARRGRVGMEAGSSPNERGEHATPNGSGDHGAALDHDGDQAYPGRNGSPTRGPETAPVPGTRPTVAAQWRHAVGFEISHLGDGGERRASMDRAPWVRTAGGVEAPQASHPGGEFAPQGGGPRPLTSWPGVPSPYAPPAVPQAQQDSEMFDVLRQLLAGRRSLIGKLGNAKPAQNSAPSYTVSSQELQSVLGQLQVKPPAPVVIDGSCNRAPSPLQAGHAAQLRQSRRRAMAPALPEEQGDTIDLVGMLFDT